MNIAQLFVSLGIKGSEKSLGAISNVKGSLKETASSGLAAKAAIIGAVYALERMFSKSSQVGTDLKNFNATLGVSARTLQQYQYAARQVGVSNEAVEESFRGLQNTITKTLMGEGAPKGLARVSQVIGEMSAQDLEQFAREPQLLLQKLQEYARAEQHAGLRNEVLKSFGLGDDMIAALTRNAFTPEVMAKAPLYSDAEIERLDRANAAWKNLGQTIEMAFGRFNSEYGPEMVQNISNLVPEVIRLTEAFTQLADKMGLFETLGETIKGLGAFLRGDLTETVKDTAKLQYGDDGLWSQTKTFFGGLFDLEPENFQETENSKAESRRQHNELLEKARQRRENRDKGEAAPRVETEGTAPRVQTKGAAPTPNKESAAVVPVSKPALTASTVAAPTVPATVSKTTNQTITVSQSLNFQHEGKDAKQTGDSVKKAVQVAFRQLSAQAQGS